MCTAAIWSRGGRCRRARRPLGMGLACWCGVSLCSRPVLQPSASVRARPFPVLARVGPRSNSAKPASTVSRKRPCITLVLAQRYPGSGRLRPFSVKGPSTSRSSLVIRASRSSRVTSIGSPGDRDAGRHRGVGALDEAAALLGGDEGALALADGRAAHRPSSQSRRRVRVGLVGCFVAMASVGASARNSATHATRSLISVRSTRRHARRAALMPLGVTTTPARLLADRPAQEAIVVEDTDLREGADRDRLAHEGGQRRAHAARFLELDAGAARIGQGLAC